MHELEFEHLHVASEEINEVAWTADNVELTTVGIDIGSSTSHMMFARVHLQRLGTALSSRFVVVDRRIVWQSPILLTPYLPDFTIDTDELDGFIGGCYRYADIEPADIGSGTTKFDLIEKGHLAATAAIAVGGRLIVEDPKQGLVRIEEPARDIAESLGIKLALGQTLAPADRECMVARMVRLVMRMID